MKKKFSVELFYETEYPEIEAENEDEAFQQALKKWAECLPNVVIRPAEEKDRKDIACDICPYFYKDEDEDGPRCHYKWDDRCAPCEIDDFEEEEEGWEDITCDTCPHYYEDEDEDEDGPRCHCKSTDGSEPCEIEDYFYEEADDED